MSQIVPSLGLGCITEVNYIRAMVFTTLGPIVIAVLIWVKYFAASLFGSGEDAAVKAKRFAGHMYMFLILTYLVLIVSCSYLVNDDHTRPDCAAI